MHTALSRDPGPTFRVATDDRNETISSPRPQSEKKYNTLQRFREMGYWTLVQWRFRIRPC